MNKQQLAAKIWESANQMRSKIEANDYKDYILGFIFYKYLSDQLISFAQKQGMSQEEITALNEEDTATVQYIQKELGYFISYNDLFSSWLEAGSDFDIANVRDALSAFNRLIHKDHKKLFDGIFNTLQTGLSKLGESAIKQTKAVRDLLQLIKDIPMDGKQDYDVLGYIYEYLIEKFAASAGKKAGEFYTPHEVSLLMSEITAHHLKNKKEIHIYDPTSGSGSLLINIGNSLAKFVDGQNNIKYYAQELKANTYNLTRMNLVMRGILPNNIITRNGDTLEEDWPCFDENDPHGTYNPLYVDAVVSNPPYSQKWDSSHKENDPRYSRFGLAPKTKADYAFLLHDLFHLRPDGIMTIVLPHGVLFRGGEEGKIRENLIEFNHIDAIIGLPANIFFGTGIPTVVMVLKQKRTETDVLIVDASKHFTKVGKNNKLLASDIKRISDAVINRESIDKFSALISKEDLRANEYNLNIPRYVDSSEPTESWDLHATMLGGIPSSEIDELQKYWSVFPKLRSQLFKPKSSAYSELNIVKEKVNETISSHSEVVDFTKVYNEAFGDFDSCLNKQLIKNWQSVNRSQCEENLGEQLFTRLNKVDLIDKYQAYQLLDNQWQVIGGDLEIMQTEGFEACKLVIPNLVIKKKNNKETEVQDGWKGHILPFDLIQKALLAKELHLLKELENRLVEIDARLEELIDSLDEEEKNSQILNDKSDAFNKTELSKALKEIYSEIESEEIRSLKKYIKLLDRKATKVEKLDFVQECNDITWLNIVVNKDGTYSKTNISKYLLKLQTDFVFPDESLERKLTEASELLQEQSGLKKKYKINSEALHLQTKTTIENLSESQVNELFEIKWIKPLMDNLNELPRVLISRLTTKVKNLADKYETTYSDIADDINATEKKLANMLDELTGNEFDQQGLDELKELLEI